MTNGPVEATVVRTLSPGRQCLESLIHRAQPAAIAAVRSQVVPAPNPRPDAGTTALGGYLLSGHDRARWTGTATSPGRFEGL